MYPYQLGKRYLIDKKDIEYFYINKFKQHDKTMLAKWHRLVHDVLSHRYKPAQRNKGKHYACVSGTLLYYTLSCHGVKTLNLIIAFMYFQKAYHNGVTYAWLRQKSVSGGDDNAFWLAARELRERRLLFSAKKWWSWMQPLNHLGKYFSELPPKYFDWDGNFSMESKSYPSSLESENYSLRKMNDDAHLTEEERHFNSDIFFEGDIPFLVPRPSR